jgi:ParB family chromosome partitioning protein
MKKGLGRGLGALLDRDGEATAEVSRDGGAAEPGVTHIDIRLIEPNAEQPRQYFNEDTLLELAESIKSFGVIQPLIVKDCGGHYAIIAGERRFRAARIARLETLPVIVKDYTPLETLQIALIENIQRQDLTPIEEATCYKRLMEDFYFSQEDIAEKIGKNRFAVSAAVRLLELDPRVRDLVASGQLTASHARLLLAIKDNEMQFACAQKIIEKDLSVRGAEALVSAMETAAPAGERQDALVDEAVLQAYRQAEYDLKTLFGAKVNIRQGKQKGKIEIEYFSPQELDRLLCLFKTINTPV